MIHSPRHGHAGFRPLHCEGGPALLALSRRAMPLVDCGTEPVLQAYTPRFLEPLLDTNANFFFLLFSPGFTEETEKPFVEAFAGAAEYLRAQGCDAVACVSAGHADGVRDKRRSAPFAVRGRNKSIPSWIPGFRMTCWTHPGLIEDVTRRALAALDAGAAGVCFDTVFHGACPAVIGDRIIGPAGCACPGCRAAFEQHAGRAKSKHFPPRAEDDQERFFDYIAWRARCTAEAVAIWTAAIREHSPNALTAVHLLHPALANSTLIFGADTRQISQHCDAILAETGGLINFDKSGLTYDGATCDILQTLVPGCDVANAPWRAGPHIETAPPPGLWRAVLGEAASCGAAASPCASVFFDRDTLAPATLAQEPFREHRRALGEFWNWIESAPDLFEGLLPFAHVGLLHDPVSWMRSWNRSARVFLGMYAALAELHVPFRIVSRGELQSGAPRDVKLLIVPPGIDFTEQEIAAVREGGALLLFIGPAPGWAPESNREVLEEALFPAKPAPRFPPSHDGSPGPYMQHRVPAPGRAARWLETYPRVTVPEEWKRIFDTVQELRARAGDGLVVEAPPYIAVRLRATEQGDRIVAHAAHLLPGFNGPSHLRLCVPGALSARILTPDRNRIAYVQEPSMAVEIITFAAIDFRMK